jgi:hypothetical protein
VTLPEFSVYLAKGAVHILLSELPLDITKTDKKVDYQFGETVP